MPPPEAPTPAGRQLSIRTVLLVLLIGEILAVVGVTWWLWYRHGQRAVHDVESQLRNELTDRIHDHILGFLKTPDRINQVNEDAHRMGRLPLEDVEKLREYLWRQLRAFDSISYIDVGTEADDFIGLERMADGSINMELKSPRTDGALFTYKLDDAGALGAKKVRPNFHTRGRPWYRRAVEAGDPAWTEVYPFFSLPVRLGLTAVRPIRNKSGNVLGVLGCDLVLTHLSRFLQGIEVGKTGRTCILERTGHLVASSSEAAVMRPVGEKLERIHVRDYADPLIRAAAVELERSFGSLGDIHDAKQFAFDLGGERILVQAAPVRDPLGIDWLSVVVVPESDFMGGIEANTRTTLLLFVALIALAAVTIAITTRKITRSILDLSRDMNRIAEFHVIDEPSESSALREIHTMQTSMAGMKKALRSFGKYVPTDVVRRLVRTKLEARLGVEPAEVTIFFSDIEDFTRLSEQVAHDTLVEIMGEYLDELSGIIHHEGGTVDKYIGDAIMAFWNAPEPVENHRAAAVRAALTCQERTRELNVRWAKKGWPQLRTRIGLHSGPVLVGNLGSHRRMNYTIIGDPVNLCSRLEGLNKLFGTSILISEAVQREIAEAILCRPIDVVVVKGKTELIRIYEPVSLIETSTQQDRERVECYATALEHYHGRRFPEAAALFEHYLELAPGDRAAELLHTRAATCAETPPAADWDGAHRLDHK